MHFCARADHAVYKKAKVASWLSGIGLFEYFLFMEADLTCVNRVVRNFS